MATANYYYKTINDNRENESLVAVHDRLSEFFITALLKYMSPAFAREKEWTGHHYDMGLLEALLPYLQAHIEAQPPLLKLHYWLVMLWYYEEKRVDLSFMLHKLNVHKNDVSRYELKNIYFSIVNYYAFGLRTDRKKNLSSQMILFKDMLANELFFFWGGTSYEKMIHHYYKNIVRVALQNEEPLKWIEDFITQYQPRVKRCVETDKVFVLVESWMLFAQGKFIEVVQNLSLYAKYFLVTYYNVDCNILIIKSLYELYIHDNKTKNTEKSLDLLKDYLNFASYTTNISIKDALEDKLYKTLENLRVYLSRKSDTIPPKVIENCMDFIKVMKLLIAFKPVEIVSAPIHQNPGIREINWLLRKIEEL